MVLSVIGEGLAGDTRDSRGGRAYVMVDVAAWRLHSPLASRTSIAQALIHVSRAHQTRCTCMRDEWIASYCNDLNDTVGQMDDLQSYFES